MSKRNIFPVDKSLEQPERVMLVGVMLSADYSGANEVRERTFQTTLDEAAELVAAAGGELVLRETAKRDKAHTAYFVGTGKAEELAAAVKLHDIGLAVFNHELTPTQERNLEKILQCRVLDRVGLILAIFAKRAQSQEGKLQVELAQLNHLSGRLVRGYGHLQSQKGGIGLKGPGETQLETDRRLIGQKITALKKQLAQVKKQRATRRKSRMEGRLKTFTIVGYTNAGKSSLFNRLTKADVLAEDQLFATLDTTARRLFLSHEAGVILTDTVGFVRDLPHKLVSAFSATLEETALADVLLHVVDASNPDFERQMDDVNVVLEEIGAHEVPQLVVYNKIDLLPEGVREAGVLRDNSGRAVGVNISVTKSLGLDALREAMIERALENGGKRSSEN
ncbi:GTPase HflX [Neisseria sp. HMSC064F04]|mgnify:FL=1|uniref:GTPase HflX n=1 Tax=Neisseria TaxID=482 RepID=UPI0008A48C14|nr:MULTISPECIES: GTPase HflX [Neisseria]MBS5836383.1 GTPase HflX [Neisseria sp.]OFN01906.1 GTPase HflX [Neisseria sp. HMSC055F11]OFN33032.1 GTPase HflX [Neisseria sp. HMSC059F02]OHR42574.1 GTPase HflX [Neisseria sp. HMSC064F04]OHR44467.1 GTPase HflX [Neisseria sp. HMSC070E12]